MDENKEILELLRQIESNSRKQVKEGRMQYILALTSIVCCVALVAALAILLPHLVTILNNLEQASAQLAAMDIEGLMADMNTLVSTGQSGMDKLNSIDMETLNRAIQNLSDVVEPMAKFFNVFK